MEDAGSGMWTRRGQITKEHKQLGDGTLIDVALLSEIRGAKRRGGRWGRREIDRVYTVLVDT